MTRREEIEARLQEILEAEGEVTPDLVIEDARDEESPLHGEFEWDVEKAAMEAWRATARRLIRSVSLVVNTEAVYLAVPRYVRNPDAETREQSYVSTSELRTDRDRAWAALSRAIDAADAMIRRAEKVAVAVGLADEVRLVATALEQVKQKVAAA